jgi:sugar/nucleoside kinase (ribokinase family)
MDDDLLGQCSLCYFDGYLLDFPGAARLVEKIIGSAKRHGTTLALGLADPFVVERHREALIALLPHVHLLFSNQDEIQSLGGLDNVVDAADQYRHEEMTVVVTRGELGAIIVGPSGVFEIEAVPVEAVVDVTGAGDLFAAGMIYGIVRGADTATGARLGALAASEVISHLGARPECSLIDLARMSGIVQ